MAFWTSSDKTKVKKLKEEGCVTTFSVEVPSTEAEGLAHNAYLQIQQRASLPGFRQGKAPIHIIEKQFAGAARERVVDQAVKKLLPDLLEGNGLKPVSPPLVSSVAWAKGKPLSFQLTVESAPRFEPKDYVRIPVAKKEAAVSDLDVEARLAELAERNARLERAPEEAVGPQHYVVIDYQGWMDGKPQEGLKGQGELVDLSAPQTIAGLSGGLQGAKRGESRAIESEAGGRKARFEVTVREIKSKVLPPLDDEFSKDLGFSNLQDLRSKAREALVREAVEEQERNIRRQIEEALLKANRIPAPPSVVEAHFGSLLQGLKERLLGPGREWTPKEMEGLRAKLWPKAEEEIRLSYILRAVAHREKIEVTAQDVNSELQKMLEAASNPSEKEKVKAFFETRSEDIQAALKEKKVLAFLKSNAKMVQ